MSISSPERTPSQGGAPDVSGCTEEQKFRIYKEAVDNRKNLFLTGGGGTGKSWLTRHIKEGLVAKHGDQAVQICTPNWLSALQVDAHAKVHHKIFWVDRYSEWESIYKSGKDRKIKAIKTLIIDEISMVSGSRLDLIDRISRCARKRDEPFGGMQIIVVGDFYQLPPIMSRESNWCPNTVVDKGYAFESKAWKDAKIVKVELTQSKRLDGGHEEFHTILNEIREGNSNNALKLKGLTASERFGDSSSVYCTNAQVSAENNSKLGRLPGREEVSKVIVSTISWNGQDQVRKWKEIRDDDGDNMLRSKEGAPVLCTVNLVVHGATDGKCKRLANGSSGTILEYVGHEAWQSEMECRLKTFQECRQNGGTTSLSGGGVETTDLEQEIDKLHFLQEAVKHFGERTHVIKVPRVRFESIKEDVIMLPCHYFVDKGRGEPGKRYQDQKEESLRIPLKLAWAITVHKAQGMSLRDLTIDVSKTFTPGQVYTALSRARDPRTLFIEGDHEVLKERIAADPKVREFYNDHSGGYGSISQACATQAGYIARIVTREEGSKIPDSQRSPQNKCDKCGTWNAVCLEWKGRAGTLLDEVMRLGVASSQRQTLEFLTTRCLPAMGYSTNDLLHGVQSQTLVDAYRELLEDEDEDSKVLKAEAEKLGLLKPRQVAPRFQRILTAAESMYRQAPEVMTTQESATSSSSGGGAAESSQSSAGGGSPVRQQNAVIHRVYRIACRDKKHYVGYTTKSLEERFEEHALGEEPGAEWTRRYPPIRIDLVQEFDNELAALDTENGETTRLMDIYGVENVRGGDYAGIELSKGQLAAIGDKIDRIRKRKREQAGM